MTAHVLAEIRARPQHLALVALLGGLVLGPRSLLALALLAAGCVALTGTPRATLLVAVLALAGAVAGSARLHAYDEVPLRAWLGHAIRAEAVLTGPPQRRPWGGWQAPAQLRGRWDGARVQLRTGAGVPVPVAGTGAVLGVVGGLRAVQPAEAYLRRRGIGAVLQADGVTDRRVLRGGLTGAVDALRRRAEAALRTGVPPRQGALLVGMVLGDASGLDQETADAMRAAGLTHLVAASGANVALLVALVFGAGVLLGADLRWRIVGALVAIAVYVPLAGAGPSIARAAVMGAATLVAMLAGRPATRWYALLLAAVVTVLLNPRAIEDPGWQLSYVAVVAILLGAGPLAAQLRRRRVPGAPAEVLAVTLVATLATAPLVAWHFDRASLVAIPANVLVAPVVAPVMWLGFGAALLAQVSLALAGPLVWLAAVPAGFVLRVGQVAAALPGAAVTASPLVVTAVVAAVLAGVVLVVRQDATPPAGQRARAAALIGAVLVLVAGLGLLRLGSRGPDVPPGFQVAFLDVGQGDATLLRHGRSAVLVDSGPPDGHVLDRLEALGVRRLDVLVITHAQADHDGGAAAVLGALPVGLLLDGRDGVRDPAGLRAVAEAGRRGVRRVAGTAGMVVRAGPIALRVLSPPPARTASTVGADPNDRAIVALAQDGPTRVLLTADAESPVLSGLALPAVDILKVSHHGSADDGLPALLRSLRPRVAGIEVGAHNTYGHPAPATVAALRRGAGVVVRTDEDGTVTVTPSGRSLAVSRGT